MTGSRHPKTWLTLQCVPSGPQLSQMPHQNHNCYQVLTQLCDKCEVLPIEFFPVWCTVKRNPLLEAFSSRCGCHLGLQPYPDGPSLTWMYRLLGRSLIIQSDPTNPAV